VDDYISAAPKETRAKLEEVREAIREVAPTALEGISYRLPFYDYKGRLAWFGLQKRHIGLYIRPPVMEKHKNDLMGYKTTVSAVHLPLDKEVPVALVKKLVEARMKINDAEGNTKLGTNPRRQGASERPLPLKFGTIEQAVFFEATPEEVYDALLDPKKHSQFTGSPAATNSKKGATFTAWEGYITGKNLELVKGKRIVQDWRTTEFPDYYPFSRLELTLKAKKGGTELKMVHSKVPADQVAEYTGGWKSAYWDPLKDYFAQRNGTRPPSGKRRAMRGAASEG
jgi:uncharacterized protein YdhG (YjbR/CyaY superfamily)/uncharacterized protein YndB with AHSA1/START domain